MKMIYSCISQIFLRNSWRNLARLILSSLKWQLGWKYRENGNLKKKSRKCKCTIFSFFFRNHIIIVLKIPTRFDLTSWTMVQMKNKYVSKIMTNYDDNKNNSGQYLQIICLEMQKILNIPAKIQTNSCLSLDQVIQILISPTLTPLILDLNPIIHSESKSKNKVQFGKV